MVRAENKILYKNLRLTRPYNSKIKYYADKR